MKSNAVNQEAYMFLKALIGEKNIIWDLYVEGRWLKAVLSSGVTFSVKNEGNPPKTWVSME